MTDRAVFLDKDGTLIVNEPYNVDPRRIRLQPHAGEALRAFHAQGYRVVIVTNQSGVARGLFPEEALAAVENRLRVMLSELDVPLAGFYYCPHHPDGTVPAYAIDCSCRKPKPGLVLRACRELRIDARQSWLIGDILNDIEAGRSAGCRTILLRNGNETEWIVTPSRLPHHIVADFREAKRVVMAADKAAVVMPICPGPGADNQPGGIRE